MIGNNYLPQKEEVGYCHFPIQITMKVSLICHCLDQILLALLLVRVRTRDNLMISVDY